MLIGYVVITCAAKDCGISFAVPSRWDEQKRKDHTSFYCPNGHCRVYNGESKEEKLRRERDRLAQRIAQKDDEIAEKEGQLRDLGRSLIATKGVVTRVRRRHAAGVCPCCNRTFSQIQAHMKTKHPTYTVEREKAS